MFDFEFLGSGAFQILKIMYDRVFLDEANNQYTSIISQKEIIDLSHYSKSKVNQNVILLKEKGYLLQNKQCRYVLTDKTLKIFKALEQI